MTKIVINKCYGGFGLSPRATVEYLKCKGKQAYFYDRDYKTDKFVKVDIKQADMLGLFYYTFTRDFGDKVEKSIAYADQDFFNVSFDIPRDDPDLVTIVEELGEESYGMHAKLTVVEIPDDVDWEIDEYDGMECISEKHRSWC